MGILVVEYGEGGRVISDFGLEEFVEDVENIIYETPVGTNADIKVSSWIAFQRLRLAVLRGEIAEKKLLFAFQNLVGKLDENGQVEWDGQPNNWPRGCGDIDLAICGELLRGQSNARKVKRDGN